MSQGLRKYRYFKLHKPYGYLCQFTGEASDKLLGDLYDFPKDIYSVGRLDKDSEGLLILTNDNRFKTEMISPKMGIKKTYWVQVEGRITDRALEQLRDGSIVIKHKGKEHRVLPADCIELETPDLEERDPPIRYRANISTSWIALSISEGKNRQVRKMTAAVGFPTLRLVRVSIGDIELNNLRSGEVEEIKPITR